MKNKMMHGIASTGLFVLLLAACGDNAPAVDSQSQYVGAAVNSIADRYYAAAIRHQPEIAYFSGVSVDRHDGMMNNSPDSLLEHEAVIDELLADLEAVDADVLVGRPEWISYAYLLQDLRAQVATRICRQDLWSVDQMGGWQLGYSQIAQLQPVGSDELRKQSLARWSKLDDFVEQEISSLENGLELGYSAPKSVVTRVIAQVDGILELDVEDSPFYSPAARDDDTEFAEATYELVTGQINPALQRYRDYLADNYLQKARPELSVTANPNGHACYEASLRAYTTVDRSGGGVYELGQQTVEANKQRVIELGREAYGVDGFAEIIKAVRDDASDRFADKDELLEFSKAAVKRAELEMPNWVLHMPNQPVSVVPFPEQEEGTGRSAHYRPGDDERPGEYRIPLHKAEEQQKGLAEAIAFHETWPGHHLQVAAAKAVDGLHPVTQIIWFSGPGEGWARYSESLAAEMGIYQKVTGQILRAAWRARGMVVDPGIHLYGWTREQAVDYMAASGNYSETEADAMVDRIAVMPGQLTSYDSGGLEIFALRAEAEAALGDDFDIREFHDRILENGTIPMVQLRERIEAWLAE